MPDFKTKDQRTPEEDALVHKIADALPAMLPVNHSNVPQPYHMRVAQDVRWCRDGNLWAYDADPDVDDRHWCSVYPHIPWWRESDPATARPPLGNEYHVHLYPTVRVRINKQWGWSMPDVIETTAEKFYPQINELLEHAAQPLPAPDNWLGWDSCDPGIVYIEDGEDLKFALVDVPGDEEFDKSRSFELTDQGWVCEDPQTKKNEQ